MIRSNVRELKFALMSMPELTLLRHNFLDGMYDEVNWLEMNCRGQYEVMTVIKEDLQACDVYMRVYIVFENDNDKTMFDLTWK